MKVVQIRSNDQIPCDLCCSLKNRSEPHSNMKIRYGPLLPAFFKADFEKSLLQLVCPKSGQTNQHKEEEGVLVHSTHSQDQDGLTRLAQMSESQT